MDIFVTYVHLNRFQPYMEWTSYFNDITFSTRAYHLVDAFVFVQIHSIFNRSHFVINGFHWIERGYNLTIYWDLCNHINDPAKIRKVHSLCIGLIVVRVEAPTYFLKIFSYIPKEFI